MRLGAIILGIVVSGAPYEGQRLKISVPSSVICLLVQFMVIAPVCLKIILGMENTESSMKIRKWLS